MKKSITKPVAKRQSKPVTVDSLKKKVQVQFNSFIRNRDKDLPCISCGEMKDIKQAGHFMAVKGGDGLRFDERNVNGECSGCNAFSQSHLIFYYENLKKKLGDDFPGLMEDIYNERKNHKKWAKEELEGLLAKYKKLHKSL
jgi:hypothetical protein